MTHRGIQLRHKLPRFDEHGRKIQPPYILDAWCPRCGMALIAGEFHPVEVCDVRRTDCDADAAAREAAKIARMRDDQAASGRGVDATPGVSP